MKIKQELKIHKCDDVLRIKWDDRETECEIGIYFRGKDNKNHYLEVDLCNSLTYIEEVIESRAEIRKELEHNNLSTLLTFIFRQHKIDMVIDFITSCLDNDIDISDEIKLIKEKYINEIIKSLEQTLKYKTEYLKEYNIFSKRYKELKEEVLIIKNKIKFIKNLK